MSNKAHLSPQDFSPLFGQEFGAALCIVASDRVRAMFDIAPDDSVEVVSLSWDGPDRRPALLRQLQTFRDRAQGVSVLWIAEDEFEHFNDEEIEGVKLAALCGFSELFTPRSLAQIFRIVCEHDYPAEMKREETFLQHLDGADHIVFQSRHHDATARFMYQDVEHWFSIHGALQYGQQAVLPTGELSALVSASGDYDEQASFTLDGRVVLQGAPIVHRGSPQVSREGTRACYEALSPLFTNPVLADVEAGRIVRVASVTPAGQIAVSALEALFAGDPRYRKIHEIGFGTNPQCAHLVKDNFFANERYPGVHFGLGLGSYTDFHIDLVTTDPQVRFVYDDGREVDLYETLPL